MGWGEGVEEEEVKEDVRLEGNHHVALRAKEKQSQPVILHLRRIRKVFVEEVDVLQETAKQNKRSEVKQIYFQLNGDVEHHHNDMMK